jgi:hypothetical protein
MNRTKVRTFEVRFRESDLLVDVVVDGEDVRVFSLRPVPPGSRGYLVRPHDPDATHAEEAARTRANRADDQARGGQTYHVDEPTEGKATVALSAWPQVDRFELYALVRKAAAR